MESTSRLISTGPFDLASRSRVCEAAIVQFRRRSSLLRRKLGGDHEATLRTVTEHFSWITVPQQRLLDEAASAQQH